MIKNWQNNSLTNLLFLFFILLDLFLSQIQKLILFIRITRTQPIHRAIQDLPLQKLTRKNLLRFPLLHLDPILNFMFQYWNKLYHQFLNSLFSQLRNISLIIFPIKSSFDKLIRSLLSMFFHFEQLKLFFIFYIYKVEGIFVMKNDVKVFISEFG